MFNLISAGTFLKSPQIKTLEISFGSWEISFSSGMDFQIPPSFWWSTDKMSLNCVGYRDPMIGPHVHMGPIFGSIELKWKLRSCRKNIPTLSPFSICHNRQFVICRNLRSATEDCRPQGSTRKVPKPWYWPSCLRKLKFVPFHRYFTNSCQIALMRKIVLFYTNQWNFMKSSYSTEQNLSDWENIDSFFHFFAKGFTTLKTIKLP